MSQKIHEVKIIKTDNSYLYLEIDNRAYRIRWKKCSPKLAQASQTEREYMEISPSGYGLHWPLIDEDLAVTPLLEHAEALTDEVVSVEK